MGYPHFSGDCVDFHDRVIDWGGGRSSDVVKPKGVVTLCGSTKFMDAFLAEQRRLTLEGFIVISVGLFGHDEVWLCKQCGFGEREGQHHNPEWAQSYHKFVPKIDLGTEDAPSETKLMLDNLHFRKIDLADRVHIINAQGYIGYSTGNELHYAYWRGRDITYMDPDSPADPSMFEHVYADGQRPCQRFGCGAARSL